MISKKDVYMLNAKTSVRVPMMKLSLLGELRQQLKDKVLFYWKGEKAEIRAMNDLIMEVLGVEGESK